jgi:hypothetical protein
VPAEAQFESPVTHPIVQVHHLQSQRGLPQPVVIYVAGHLVSYVLAHAWFGSPWVRHIVYADEFTKDAIHECGEASLGFPVKFSLENSKKLITYKPAHPNVHLYCLEQMPHLHAQTLLPKIIRIMHEVILMFIKILVVHRGSLVYECLGKRLSICMPIVFYGGLILYRFLFSGHLYSNNYYFYGQIALQSLASWSSMFIR